MKCHELLTGASDGLIMKSFADHFTKSSVSFAESGRNICTGKGETEAVLFRFGKFGFPPGDDVFDEITRSETLAKDLADLRAGVAPAKDRLAEAPLLADFVFLLHPTIVCMGNVTGHAGGRGAALMHTSEVIVDGSSHGWLRTRSTYYRLGRQLTSPVRSISSFGRDVPDNRP